MKPSPQQHTRLFRVVSTIVFSLLLMNTVALNYPQTDDPLSQFLSTLEYIFFGSTDETTSTISLSSPSDSCVTNGIDPTQEPPPPPPPK